MNTDVTEENLIRTVNSRIQVLNKKKIPVIFLITGNNSTGKTTLAKLLLQKLDFVQTVNLGIVSKLMRFFRPNIQGEVLENFDSPLARKLFVDIVDFIIDHYYEAGVNLLIDGVQIDTNHLKDNSKIVGGVILRVDDEKLIARLKHSKTRFNRRLAPVFLSQDFDYQKNKRFRFVDNNGDPETLLETVLVSLDELLSKKK
ncbi:MAG: AAA family ATPase [Patescibacteria group bacterium]